MSSPSTFNALEMIRVRRRALREHTDEELQWWINAYTESEIPDYQMAAWLMAVCFNTLSTRETATLTRCMVESGVTLDWKNFDRPLVDKHSTGGVGDKVSIVLAPLVASLGVAVPMMAGRGLGHTGGTIDKLESIPGFRTELTVEEFQNVVRTVGCAIATTGPDLCPADKKLYGLRDVTYTVSSIPLQTASIMCKKIAENPNSLILDVKYGSGAFQHTVEEAEELAKSMVATGEANCLNPTTAFLTHMDHPIGYAVGNWVEIKECIHILQGNLQAQPLSHDLIALVVIQAAEMLLQSGQYPDKSFDELVELAHETLDQGKALSKFREMVVAQGGHPSVIDNPSSYPHAPKSGELICDQDGFLVDMNALKVGNLSVELGAGRKIANEPVDWLAGIVLYKKVGESVRKGDLLAHVYTRRTEVLSHVLNRLREIIEISNERVEVPPIVTHRVSKDECEKLALPSILNEKAN